MENYVLIVLLLAPGFLTCKISEYFDKRINQQNKLDMLMRYFIYSFFTFFLSILISVILEILPWKYTLTEVYTAITTGFSVGGFILLLFIVIITSIFVGAAWPWLLKKIVACLNKRREKANISLIPTQSQLLEDRLEDDRDHLIAVEKNGITLSFGLYAGMQLSDLGKAEIEVFNYPQYTAFFTNLDRNDLDSFCIGTYILLEDDVIVREYNKETIDNILLNTDNSNQEDTGR